MLSRARSAVAWNAATSLLDLLEPLPDGPEGLDFWSYHLIDAQRHDLSPLIGSKSPLTGLFRLEQLEDMQGLSEAVDDLKVVLELADQELADASVTFINQAVLPRLVSEGDNIPTIRDLQEVPTMIGQRIERIKEEIAHQARSKGLQEGRQEGRQEGLQEGRQAMLKELIQHKFGELGPELEIRLRQASRDDLLAWSRRMLTATTLDEIFSDSDSSADSAV